MELFSNNEELKELILWCKEQNADFVEVGGTRIHFRLVSEDNLMKSLEDFSGTTKKTEQELKDEYRKLALYSSRG